MSLIYGQLRVFKAITRPDRKFKKKNCLVWNQINLNWVGGRLSKINKILDFHTDLQTK